MLIEQKDKDFISKYFSDLYFEESGGNSYLKGKLKFIASFDFNTKDYDIYKDIQSANGKDNIIEDEYDIEINLLAVNTYRVVKEIGNKIEKNPDMHINPHSGTACVAGYLDEDPNILFEDFFYSIIIPFFYDQSFFKNNNFWPRGVFPHGCIGILVNYHQRSSDSDHKKLTIKCIEILQYLGDNNLDSVGWTKIKDYLLKKRIKERWVCICGSGKLESCERCGPEVLKGLCLLHKNIKKYQLTI